MESKLSATLSRKCQDNRKILQNYALSLFQQAVRMYICRLRFLLGVVHNGTVNSGNINVG